MCLMNIKNYEFTIYSTTYNPDFFIRKDIIYLYNISLLFIYFINYFNYYLLFCYL